MKVSRRRSAGRIAETEGDADTNTYPVQISYAVPPIRCLQLSVANAVAKSYVEHTYNIRFRSSASLSIFMEKQLEELRAKIERSDSALAQFEKELNVINPVEKTRCPLRAPAATRHGNTRTPRNQ